MMVHRLETLFPHEIEERLKIFPVLILPLGTIEWHGLHLPLGLDGTVAEAICEKIAKTSGAVLAPTSYWAAGGVPFPFTLRLNIEQFEPILQSLLEQFAKMGFRVIVAFTGHFGLDQTLALKRAAWNSMSRSTSIILPLTEYDLTTDLGYLGDHAATGEVSLMMACAPELVRLDNIPVGGSPGDIIGEDPRLSASRQRGETLIEVIVDRAVSMIQRFLAEWPNPERSSYLDAVASGIKVLEETRRQRTLHTKDKVPPVVTPNYSTHCQALYQGDYGAARAAAECKLRNLAE